MMSRKLAWGLCLLLLAGCRNPVQTWRVDGHVPDINLDRIAPPWVLRVDHIVAGAMLYYAWHLKDESVWDAEVKPAGQDRYRITMRKDRLLDKGDGEASVLFKLTAEDLSAKNQCASMRTLEYTERLASQVIGTQRIAEGLVECVRMAGK